jgi:hypothetical protein
MSEASDRLAQTRLAIIQHVQQKKEARGGGFREALRNAAAAVGLRSSRNREDRPREPSSSAAEAGREPATAAYEAYEAKAEVSREAIEQDEDAPLHGPDSPAQRHERRAQHLFGDRFAGIGQAAQEYWRSHPARLVLELATPAMSSYAQRHPGRFLAYSAGAGALIYLARPWRLISVTGLAVAALRSPQVSSALISAFYGRRNETHAPDMPDMPK